MRTIRDMITALAGLEDNPHKVYHTDMAEAVQTVKVTPCAEVFNRNGLASIKSCVKPEVNMCYRNAYEFARMFPNIVQYVEGKILPAGAYPFDHAWNKVGDLYVDITVDMAIQGGGDILEYAVLGEYSAKEVEEVMNVTGVYGGVWDFLYLLKK